MNLIENIRKNNPFVSKTTLETDEVARLETALAGALVSVAPRQDFVQRLNRQLITAAPLARKQPAVIMISEQKTRENLLIGAATLIGAAAIFATGFRVAITFLGLIGFLIQWVNRKPLEKAPVHIG